MALRFSLLLLLIAAVSSATADGEGSADLLIRQVVGSGSTAGDATADASLSELDDHSHHHFSLFKTRFGKSYATQEEHNYRFKVFRANLRRAKRHQALDPTATHGVTQFSDLTPSEFRRQFLGVRTRLKFPAHANKAPLLPTYDLPLDFDWRDHGAVTSVKNQVF